jgi:hypothetical protein
MIMPGKKETGTKALDGGKRGKASAGRVAVPRKRWTALVWAAWV